ncbi:hypothetical protein [Hyalangium minutum]|uniref:Putative lipoprotein n=1 Tax=Hyalangium minutum TaxID=394096 RepID=A0A085W032_9BACT|nr:hypothetical protein [Hyalangium minutum]KFE61045.1 putative lipoprotein [Hyalangium minutum]
MRAGWGRGLVLTLALGACRVSGPSASADAGQPPPPPPPGAATGASCEAMLPSDLREWVLPGFTVKEDRACARCGPLCTFRAAAEPGTTVSLSYNCEPKDPSVEVRELLAPTLNAGGVEVPALGRAAARRSPVPGMLQVVAWDDDTPCVVVVTWMGTGPERAVDVMRTALQAANPAALDAVRDIASGGASRDAGDAGPPPSDTGDAGSP